MPNHKAGKFLFPEEVSKISYNNMCSSVQKSTISLHAHPLPWAFQIPHFPTMPKPTHNMYMYYQITCKITPNHTHYL